MEDFEEKGRKNWEAEDLKAKVGRRRERERSRRR